MDRHVRVLQRRVEPHSVDGRELSDERTRRHDQQHKEERTDQREDHDQPWLQLAKRTMRGTERKQTEPREDRDPQEQRARLRAPPGRKHVAHRQRARRRVGDDSEREVVRENRVQEDRIGNHNKHENRPQRVTGAG